MMDALAGVNEEKRKGQGVHPSPKGRPHHTIPSRTVCLLLCCSVLC